MFDVNRMYLFLDRLGLVLRGDFGLHSVVASEIASVTYEVNVRQISESVRNKWDSNLRTKEPAPKVTMRFEYIEHTYHHSVEAKIDYLAQNNEEREALKELVEPLDSDTIAATIEGANNRGRRVPWEDDSYPW